MLVSDSWLYLLVAIPFGVLGTISMKLSQGLSKWKPTVCITIFYLISFIALTLAIKGIAISIVYAIWSGAGTILVAMIGMLIFEETVSVKKIFSLVLIVIGIVGIHLANAAK